MGVLIGRKDRCGARLCNSSPACCRARCADGARLIIAHRPAHHRAVPSALRPAACRGRPSASRRDPEPAPAPAGGRPRSGGRPIRRVRSGRSAALSAPGAPLTPHLTCSAPEPVKASPHNNNAARALAWPTVLVSCCSGRNPRRPGRRLRALTLWSIAAERRLHQDPDTIERQVFFSWLTCVLSTVHCACDALESVFTHSPGRGCPPRCRGSWHKVPVRTPLNAGQFAWPLNAMVTLLPPNALPGLGPVRCELAKPRRAGAERDGWRKQLAHLIDRRKRGLPGTLCGWGGCRRGSWGAPAPCGAMRGPLLTRSRPPARTRPGVCGRLSSRIREFASCPARVAFQVCAHSDSPASWGGVEVIVCWASRRPEQGVVWWGLTSGA